VAKDQLRDAVCAHVVRVLKEERKRQRVSMEVIAERSGLSQSMISLVERDMRNPTLDTLLRIADTLKVDLGAIITKARKAAQTKGGGVNDRQK
jgi:transcriptional regulator with XRE-family HTH domain